MYKLEAVISLCKALCPSERRLILSSAAYCKLPAESLVLPHLSHSRWLTVRLVIYIVSRIVGGQSLERPSPHRVTSLISPIYNHGSVRTCMVWHIWKYLDNKVVFRGIFAQKVLYLLSLSFSLQISRVAVSGHSRYTWVTSGIAPKLWCTYPLEYRSKGKYPYLSLTHRTGISREFVLWHLKNQAFSHILKDRCTSQSFLPFLYSSITHLL